MSNQTPIEEMNDDLQVSRNSLTVLITGILIIVAAFVTYNFFADRSAKQQEGQDTTIAQLQEELNKDDKSADEDKANTDDKANGKIAVKDSSKDKGAVAGSSTTKDSALAANTGGPEPGAYTAWTARDLSPNSISGKSYTVQSGDTLWEIAEARYGSGYEWVKVLDANVNDVGFLASGQHALIAPGQQLALPN